jgi:hypothetical protein
VDAKAPQPILNFRNGNDLSVLFALGEGINVLVNLEWMQLKTIVIVNYCCAVIILKKIFNFGSSSLQDIFQ